MQARTWFHERGERTFTLFCLPPAGAAGTFFRAWEGRMDDGITLLPATAPGRLHRLAEPAITEFDQYVASIGEEVAQLAAGPFAIFGHSLGGLIAFELAHWLKAEAELTPQRLIVSACAPPLADHVTRARRYLSLADAELLSATGPGYDLLPDSLCEELRELAMAAFRDDLRLIASYRYRQRPPLGCVMNVLYGRSDPLVNPVVMPGWTKETAREAELVEFAGGHMFIREAGAAVRSLARAPQTLEPAP